VPSHLSFEEAATLPCAAVTAWVALTGRRQVTAGDTVLTQGSGGVSVFALQFARLLGARVIATTSTVEKAERLKEVGASEVLNYTETPELGREGARANRWPRRRLHGRDRRAGDDRNVVEGLGCEGHVSLIGGSLSRSAAGLDPLLLTGRGITLGSISVGSRTDFEAMNRAIAIHHLPIAEG
jgi:D-arabinose 1-dehydrogenase-like Zn-dependent alcohol dehydrogenase